MSDAKTGSTHKSYVVSKAKHDAVVAELQKKIASLQAGQARLETADVKVGNLEAEVEALQTHNGALKQALKIETTKFEQTDARLQRLLKQHEILDYPKALYAADSPDQSKVTKREFATHEEEMAARHAGKWFEAPNEAADYYVSQHQPKPAGDGK